MLTWGSVSLPLNRQSTVKVLRVAVARGRQCRPESQVNKNKFNNPWATVKIGPARVGTVGIAKRGGQGLGMLGGKPYSFGNRDLFLAPYRGAAHR